LNVASVTLKAVRICICAGGALALLGCQLGPGQEITSKKPYADVVGARYSVIGDNLYAYGVYESNNRTLSYVVLVPALLGGPEYAFRKTVPKGQVLKILSAWQLSTLLGLVEVRVYYLVELEHSDLPQGVPVRLQLDRGNEGVGADLNPAFYRRIGKGN